MDEDALEELPEHVRAQAKRTRAGIDARELAVREMERQVEDAPDTDEGGAE